VVKQISETRTNVACPKTLARTSVGAGSAAGGQAVDTVQKGEERLWPDVKKKACIVDIVV
jgi:hypothetical protein